MPVTYNGIGTHYYGKKNLETHPGVCRQCGRGVSLSSYDTRLWFVIVFIPVIPLGRKRIIEQCPACRRHFASDLDKWEAAKQVEISGALEKFRANPTPEAAIAAHQQLINFHQTAQAADFRQMLVQKFAEDAKVHSYLGNALTQLGRPDEAASYFRRALELRPDLPEARAGMARSLLRAQRLDEARKLLDFLEKPGAEQLYSLEPLEQLAIAYQRANRHTEALELLGKLRQAIPGITDHSAFRKLVAKSEKALGRKDSSLPKRPFSWRRLFSRDRQVRRIEPAAKLTWRKLAVPGVIIALFVLGMAIANEYIRRHRTLYVVNSLASPATVEFPGAGQIQAPRGVTELILAEGRHRAIITGPVRQEVDFEIDSGYFARWFSDPAWILNLDGASVLLVREAVYSQNPQPVKVSFHFGQVFEHFPRVTNPFRPLPDSVQMKAGETRSLTQIELFRGEMENVFYYFQGHGQTEQALQFAEWLLLRQPDNEQMIRLYAAAVDRQRQLDRAEKFLGAGLTNRPFHTEWHRAYQNLRQDGRRDERLRAFYDDMLRAEQTNSSLLYLRGRLAANHAESRPLFERAREADPRNPYPLYALGYDRAAIGDWAGAKTLLTRVVELRPKDPAFVQLLIETRIALQEWSSLEEEYRTQCKREPLNYFATLRLCDVLVAAGKEAEARQVISSFDRAATAQYKENAREASNLLRRHLLYLLGDFAGLEKDASADRSPAGRVALFQGMIEQGKVAEAVKIQLPDVNEGDEPFHFLAIALAYNVAGNASEAALWRERALKAFEHGNAEYVRSSHLLRREDGPSQAELDDLILPAKPKAIILTALAQKHASQRAELAAAARRFNIERDYPYHLIQRSTAEPR